MMLLRFYRLILGPWAAVAAMWGGVALSRSEVSSGGSASAVKAAAPAAQPTVVLVVGAVGEPQFGRDFFGQAESWQKAAAALHGKVETIGTATAQAGAPSDRERLAAFMGTEPKQGAEELWVVLIGHGTFDGAEAKFNMRGADISATDLAGWLKPFARPVVVIDTASASAPFLAALSAPNRVVITSTRSGFEQNYARFGRYLAEAIADARSDLDKDGQVSVLEAFLMAARNTTAFYKTEGRLATEHPLLDDNGDARGTPADWFKGVRATRRAEGGVELDGTRARQFALIRSAAEQELSPAARARRNELELQIERLRAEKPKLAEPQYCERLEKLLLELAAVYEGT